MKKQTENKKMEKNNNSCNDKTCPRHGHIALRGRTFRGKVIRKFPKRICIELERTLYVKKYERYAKRKTRLHARLADCMANEIEVGDYAEIMECRPLSKIIHFIAIGKISGAEEKSEEIK